MGYDDPTFVEYDLDSEDEKWLAQYCGSEVRAPRSRHVAAGAAVLRVVLTGPERPRAEQIEMMLALLSHTRSVPP